MDEPKLSQSMLDDLQAISRGKAPPARVWHERPWKVGEPCWVMIVGKGGDVHTYPARITLYDRFTMESNPEVWTPIVEWVLDPFGDEAVIFPPPEDFNDRSYQIKKVMPRQVDGESW
jgi:hypothetical protein